MDASVILTRPEGRNEPLAARLLSAGLRPLVLPALGLEPIRVDAAVFPFPQDYDLVIFVSGNAVRFYVEQLKQYISSFAWPRGVVAAAVGMSTARALECVGVDEDLILQPDPDDGQDSEALWTQLRPRLAGMERVLVVRGSRGREWLGARLEEAGLRVDRQAVYERRPMRWSLAQELGFVSLLKETTPCICLLTSSEGVDAVHANVVRLGLQNAWLQLRFLVVHERIASRLQSVIGASGKVGPPMVKICQPSDDAIYEALLQIASPSASS